MIRRLFAGALLCASAGAIACPLCMGAFQQSKAQELVSAPHAVLAVPTADPSRFRVIEVVKGERPAGGTVEGGYPRNGPVLEAAGSTSGKALLLVRDEPFPTWTILGTIDADHLGWLRKIAAGKRSTDMSAGRLAGPRRAVGSLSRESRAAGGRDRLRRARGGTVCGVAHGEVAHRRAGGTQLARRSGACLAATAVSAAAGNRGRCEGRRYARVSGSTPRGRWATRRIWDP